MGIEQRDDSPSEPDRPGPEAPETDGSGSEAETGPKTGSGTVELIAHRAGNVIDGARAVRSLADTIELDVRRDRGRLVVRHARRIWLTSRLWEREGGWHVLPTDTPVPTLAEAVASIAEIAPDIGLWIDGKGLGRRLPRRALDEANWRGPVTVSSKAWWMLSGLTGTDARVVRSVSNRLELFLLRWVPSRLRLHGIVIRSDLLSPRHVADLQLRYRYVYSWSIPDVATGTRLLSWGVKGLIVDDSEVLEGLQEARKCDSF